MPKNKQGKSKSQLGRALINKQHRRKVGHSNRGQQRPKRNLVIHPLAQNAKEPTTGAQSREVLNTTSVVEQTSLQDFVQLAQNAHKAHVLADKVEYVNRSKAKTTCKLNRQQTTATFDYKHLPIPHRPPWTKGGGKNGVGTTADELEQQEQRAFLDWRRNLANTAEESNFPMTPYEKNIEVWRQLWRVVERSDLLVHILDARNPLAYLSRDLLDYTRGIDESGLHKDKKKQCLIVMNKADYLTAQQRLAWAAYFKSQGLDVVFFSAMCEALRKDMLSDSHREALTDGDLAVLLHNEQDASPSLVEAASGSTSQLVEAGARILSCEEITARFKGSSPDGSRITTVGMVGYPNVGKSSIINALLGEKKVSVACTPGKTRHFQTHMLQGSIMLCDCPGLVFPTFVLSKAELVLNGVIPIDKLRDFVTPFDLLTTRIPLRQMKLLYTFKLETADPTPGEVLDAFAIFRGFLLRSRTPDRTGASRELLKQFVKGRLLYCKPPPCLDASERAAFLADTDRSATIRNSTAKKGHAIVAPSGGLPSVAEVAEALAVDVEAKPALERELLANTLDVNNNWDQLMGNSKRKHHKRARKMNNRTKNKDLRSKVQKKVLARFSAEQVAA